MKKILFLFLIKSFASFAQAPTWDWAVQGHIFGIIEDESAANKILIDNSDNMYVAGYFGPNIVFGIDTFSTPGLAGVDLMLIKYSPNGNIIWVRTAGSYSQDVISDLKFDPQGNILVIGTYGQAGIVFDSYVLGNSSNCSSCSDIFLAKYDTAGTVVWAKSVKGDLDEGALSSNVDANGNFYICGYFDGDTARFGNITLVNSLGWGSLQGFYAKYSASGNCLWAKKIGNFSVATGIIVDGSNHLFLTGFADSILQGGNYIQCNHKRFYAKANSTNGSISAVYPFNGLGIISSGTSIKADGMNNIYLTGNFKDTLIFGVDTLVSTDVIYGDAFIVKFDNNLNALWTIKIRSHGFEWANVSFDLLGNPYLFGNFDDTTLNIEGILLNSPSNDSTDFYIAQLTSSGNIVWTINDGRPKADNLFDIEINSMGNLYAAGYFEDTSFVFGNSTLTGCIQNSQGYAMFVAKLGHCNLIPPTITHSGNIFTSSLAYSYQWFKNGNLINGATSQNYTTSQTGSFTVVISDSLGCTALSQPWIITGINEIYEASNFILFPNPTNDKLNLEMQFEGEKEITWSDLSGRALGHISTENKTATLDVSNLQAGIYFVMLKTSSGVCVKKFVKE